MPLRAPKMYGFIRGFQRWVWWPKWAPASINCCMVTTGAAIIQFLSGYASGRLEPVAAGGTWTSRLRAPVCGAFHVNFPAPHQGVGRSADREAARLAVAKQKIQHQFVAAGRSTRIFRLTRWNK